MVVAAINGLPVVEFHFSCPHVSRTAVFLCT